MTGVLVPEAQGGSGLALLDAAIVSQAFGHAATPAPFLSSSVMATVALRTLAEEGAVGDAGAAVERCLGGIAGAEQVVGVAFTERFAVREDAGVRLESGRLRGTSLMAIDALGAERLLVAVDGATLALVEGAAAGVGIERLATVDATRCTSELVLDGVAPEALFEGAAAERAIGRALEAGRIALAADALGCCESMLERAVAYAKERKQFGRVIGSFQSVKHLCAEMVAELEPARSLLWYAAHSFDAMPDETPLLACHVLAHVSRESRGRSRASRPRSTVASAGPTSRISTSGSSASRMRVTCWGGRSCCGTGPPSCRASRPSGSTGPSGLPGLAVYWAYRLRSPAGRAARRPPHRQSTARDPTGESHAHQARRGARPRVPDLRLHALPRRSGRRLEGRRHGCARGGGPLATEPRDRARLDREGDRRQALRRRSAPAGQVRRQRQGWDGSRPRWTS